MLRIMCAGYNCSQYIHRAIESLQNQTYGDWKAYCHDDVSDDGTYDIMMDITKDDKRFNVVRNAEKLYQCGNYYQIMQNEEIKDNDICITLDLDDWFSNDSVFGRVINYYKDLSIWMSFGQFEYYDGSENKAIGFSRKPNPFNNLRNMPWCSTHLRTFKAFLFKHIKKESLIDPNTNHFWDMAGDNAIFAPMIELAGEERILYTNDINYTYNIETPLNDHCVNHANQLDCSRRILSQTPYQRLD